MAIEEAIQHIRGAFTTELAEIRDEELPEKVVRTWARAMIISGSTDVVHDQPMNPEMKTPGIGYEHVRAVTGLAAAIADQLSSLHHLELDRDAMWLARCCTMWASLWSTPRRTETFWHIRVSGIALAA